jgi:hypothetical protein
LFYKKDDAGPQALHRCGMERAARYAEKRDPSFGG